MGEYADEYIDNMIEGWHNFRPRRFRRQFTSRKAPPAALTDFEDLDNPEAPAMIEGPGLKRDAYGIEIRSARPRNWRTLTSEPWRITDTEVQCAYYGWLLWFRKDQLLRVDDELVVDPTVLDAAKDDERAESA